MKLTKYEHACFVFEKDGASVVVDPGELTTDFMMPDHVVAVVITHQHVDHFGKEHVEDIIAANPKALVIGPADVVSQLKDYETRAVGVGDNFTIEGIELEFFGSDHAHVHPERPIVQNVGVMIEERIYYPGDSFTVPEKSVDILALPLGAPWMKLSESIDFMRAVGPRMAFPTHDAVLSHDGQGFHDTTVKSFADEADIDYRRIDGQTINVD